MSKKRKKNRWRDEFDGEEFDDRHRDKKSSKRSHREKTPKDSIWEDMVRHK